MRKKTILLALFILTFVSKSYSLDSRYNVPHEVILFKSSDDPEAGQGIPIMETRFFPVGWSQDNKFAYISYFDDYDASGLVSMQLKIIDIVTDRIVLDKAPSTEYSSGTEFNKIWNENANFFSDYLSAHSIIEHSVVLNDFPLITKDDTLTCNIQTEWIEASESDLGWPCIDHLNVEVRSAKKGFKSVYQADGKNICIGAQISGYIKNPYNNRIIIPMFLTHPGWEGPPHSTSIIIIGCHLGQGFKSESADHFELYFKDINVFEGSAALVFADDEGKEHFFSYYDIDIEQEGLCKIVQIPDAVFPEYRVNQGLIDKKFLVYYRIEERWLEFADEVKDVYVIKKLEVIE